MTEAIKPVTLEFDKIQGQRVLVEFDQNLNSARVSGYVHGREVLRLLLPERDALQELARFFAEAAARKP